ncbi:hypothetical protein D3C87_2008080 [compost metagenome]
MTLNSISSLDYLVAETRVETRLILREAVSFFITPDLAAFMISEVNFCKRTGSAFTSLAVIAFNKLFSAVLTRLLRALLVVVFLTA